MPTHQTLNVGLRSNIVFCDFVGLSLSAKFWSSKTHTSRRWSEDQEKQRNVGVRRKGANIFSNTLPAAPSSSTIMLIGFRSEPISRKSLILDPRIVDFPKRSACAQALLSPWDPKKCTKILQGMYYPPWNFQGKSSSLCFYVIGFTFGNNLLP